MPVKFWILGCSLFALHVFAQASFVGPKTANLFDDMQQMAEVHPNIINFAWRELEEPCPGLGAQLSGKSIVEYVSDLADDLYGYSCVDPKIYAVSLDEFYKNIGSMLFEYDAYETCDQSTCFKTIRYCKDGHNLIFNIEETKVSN